MSDYMPDDVLEKVLAYLPAKSLVRFTCVCKSWHSLITSRDFINTHLNQTTHSNNSNNNNHLLLLRPRCTIIPNYKQISLHADNDTFDLHKKIDFPFHSSEPYYHAYGSCNGLIFLSNSITYTTLMLWNPSIRKSLTLPRPRFMYLNYRQAFGFGFDSRTNDHKVVRLVYHISKRNVTPKVELYKLSTRSWETITARFDTSCYLHGKIVFGRFIKGAVHWIVFKMNSFLIMTFNMSDEDFYKIMPPANLHTNADFVDVSVCGEWLSLFHIFNDGRNCSLWVMKEYGVVESWTKLYTLDLQEKKLCKPLGFRKNGEPILKMLNGKLVSYDSETKQIKYLGISHYCDLCKFNNYVESLVLLGDANRLGGGPSIEASLKKKKRHFHES